MDGMPVGEDSPLTCTILACPTTIQTILRHSNISTTMNCYVKTVSADATAAMETREAVCTNNAPDEILEAARPETLVM